MSQIRILITFSTGWYSTPIFIWNIIFNKKSSQSAFKGSVSWDFWPPVLSSTILCGVLMNCQNTVFHSKFADIIEYLFHSPGMIPGKVLLHRVSYPGKEAFGEYGIRRSNTRRSSFLLGNDTRRSTASPGMIPGEGGLPCMSIIPLEGGLRRVLYQAKPFQYPLK